MILPAQPKRHSSIRASGLIATLLAALGRETITAILVGAVALWLVYAAMLAALAKRLAIEAVQAAKLQIHGNPRS